MTESIKTYTQEERIEALANFLEINTDTITEGTRANCFELTDEEGEYLVLTDEEANKAVKAEIKESVWAFNADFIIDACGLSHDKTPYEIKAITTSLQKLQESSCESCNDFILAVINGTVGLDKFVEKAVEADGRGHFLAYYDFQENKQGDSFIYRVN